MGKGSSDKPSSSSGGSISPGVGATAGSSALEESGGYSSTSSGKSVLGPDGRAASETWGDMSSGLTGLVEKNPTMAALTSLGIGLIVGMIVGAAVARD